VEVSAVKFISSLAQGFATPAFGNMSACRSNGDHAKHFYCS